VALLLNIARRLCKLLCLVKDKSLIHLSYTNRTLSFILYSLYNVHAARYTQHTTGMIIYAQATHYTICLADTLRAVFASAALRAVFTFVGTQMPDTRMISRLFSLRMLSGLLSFGWYIDA